MIENAYSIITGFVVLDHDNGRIIECLMDGGGKEGSGGETVCGESFELRVTFECREGLS